MYILISIIIMAILIFIIGRLMVSNAMLRLQINNRKLASTLKDYIIVLRVYKRILTEMKDNGQDITNMPLPWKNKQEKVYDSIIL